STGRGETAGQAGKKWLDGKSGDEGGEPPVVRKLAAARIDSIQPRLGLAIVLVLVKGKCRRPPVVQKSREVDDTSFLAGSRLAATKRVGKRDRRTTKQESLREIPACEGFGLYL